MFGRILNTSMNLEVLLSLYKYIQVYSDIFKYYCVSLPNSKHWHIPMIKHIQTPRYIHNTILSIFKKALSWTFDTALNAPLLKRNFTVSLTVSGTFKTYSALLKYVTNPGIFRNILLQAYSKRYA